jgi:hypothetical protein
MYRKEPAPRRHRGARQRIQVFGRKLPAPVTPFSHSSKGSPIRAQITGSDECAALGLVVRSSSPVLLLCRKLIAAGVDPDRQLQVYRGETVCLVVRSIGEAARLEISSGGTGFIKPARAVRPGSPAGP